MSGASEFYELAADLDRFGPEAGQALIGVFRKAGHAVKMDWRNTAKVTAGRRGKHYPYSVTYTTKVSALGVEVEIGPDTSHKQGAMGRGFEFGSMNQPPHLDGLKAQMKQEPMLLIYADAAVKGLL